MSAAVGSKIKNLERNWRRVASTHTLQDLMNADKPPAETGINIKALLSGILLITAGITCLALGIITFGAQWMLPESDNALMEAIKNDNYYHLLVPAMVPVTIIASNMENHNFAQATKRQTDFLGDLPDLCFAEHSAVNANKKRPRGRPPGTTKARAALVATTATVSHSSFKDNSNMTHLDPTAPAYFSHKASNPSTFNALPSTANTAPPNSGCTTTISAYDSLICEVCGRGEPEESILLCDRCDLGYHMGCLRPALTQVPTGAWFCDCCCNKLDTELNRRRRRHQQPRQHLAAGGSYNVGGDFVFPFYHAPCTTATATLQQQQQQQQPAFGPMTKDVSRFIAFFNSSTPPVKPSYLAQAKLQTLIFLAEHGDSTTTRIRLHFNNNMSTSNSVAKLLAAGLIHKVREINTMEYVYSLDRILLPYVEQWKEKLDAYTRALKAQERNFEDLFLNFVGSEDEEDELEEEEIEAPIARNSIPLSAATTITNAHGGSSRACNYGTSSKLFSSLRATEPFPLSDLRQAQLQTLVLLPQLGPSTLSEIREQSNDIELFPLHAKTSLFRAGLITCTENCGVGSKMNRYAINPEIMPYIHELKNKLEQHKIARNTAATATAAPQPIEEDELEEEALEAPIARNSIPNSAATTTATTITNAHGGAFRPLSKYGTSSKLFPRLCATEPFPLSDLRQAQLQTLVLLPQLGPSTLSEIREHSNDIQLFPSQTMSSLFRPGLIMCTESHGAGSKTNRYAINPDIMPYINELKNKLERHKIARKTAATAAAAALQPLVASPSLLNRPSTNSRHHQKDQKPSQPCANDLPSSLARLSDILCSDNNDEDGGSGENEEIPPAFSLTRRAQLQALIHLAEHGQAAAACLEEIYGNSLFRLGLLDMYKAGMVHREKVKKTGSPYVYALAPSMQRYLPIWKGKLEKDDLKRNASA